MVYNFFNSHIKCFYLRILQNESNSFLYDDKHLMIKLGC